MFKSFSPVFCALLLLLLFSGCAHQHSQVLFHKAEKTINKAHNISYGNLIMLYGLDDAKTNKCLNSAHYPQIINDPAYNKHYSSAQASAKIAPNKIYATARQKVKMLDKLGKKLQKYNIKFIAPIVAAGEHAPNSPFDQLDKPTHKTENSDIKKLQAYTAELMYIPTIVPLKSANITSKYGKRTHPTKKKCAHHNGLDLAAEKGSNVYAAAGGKVRFAGKKPGYGNIVIVTHKHRLETKYAHLEHISVRAGQIVIPGEKIGTQGNTGNATGDHLHFEVLVNGKHVNPEEFIGHNLICSGKTQ